MALAANVMKGGVSAGQAQAINGNAVNTAVTAAGTTQGTATAITADAAVVTTATAGQGVILYNGVIGDSQEIYNDTLVYINVYPPTGGKVNQVATNGAFVLPAKTAVSAKKMNATQWVGFQSA